MFKYKTYYLFQIPQVLAFGHLDVTFVGVGLNPAYDNLWDSLRIFPI